MKELRSAFMARGDLISFWKASRDSFPPSKNTVFSRFAMGRIMHAMMNHTNTAVITQDSASCAGVMRAIRVFSGNLVACIVRLLNIPSGPPG